MANDIAQQKEAQAVMGGIHVPIDFLCPLSLELMSDPVTIASGKTYERTHIQHWFDQGNTTCPQTRQVLSHRTLVPDYTVKAQITIWSAANSAPLEEFAKHETEVLPSKKIDADCQREVLLASRSCIDQAVPANRKRSGRSVRTIRTRSFETFDISNREIRPGLEDIEGTKAYLHVNPKPVHVEDTDGQCQAMLSRDKNGHGLNNSISSVKYRNNASLKTNSIDDNNLLASQLLNDSSSYSSGMSGEMERTALSVDHAWNKEFDSLRRVTDQISASWRNQVEGGNLDLHRTIPPSSSGTAEYDGNKIQLRVGAMVEDLQSAVLDVQRYAAEELRNLAKCNVENRIVIANAGAIRPLVSLLRSTDSQIQENSVTALLNLSINDNNKIEIAAASAFDPLIGVLTVGTSKAKENAAATLYSLSIMKENRMAIGQCGAIEPLVDLLMYGTLQGKKDAASALYNLSTLHENKARIVRANAIRPLVKLISDPSAGMVDKAVAIVANLATVQEGRVSISEEEGIPALVEVVESGSERGKENAAAALLQLCTHSSRFRAKVLHEGAVPPLVALTKLGTSRAKEKALALLRHLKEQQQQQQQQQKQRHAIRGREASDRHVDGHFDRFEKSW